MRLKYASTDWHAGGCPIRGAGMRRYRTRDRGHVERLKDEEIQ